MNSSILYSLLLLLLVLGGAGRLSAQMPTGPSNEGREFLFSFPTNWEYVSRPPAPPPVRWIRFYMTSRVATRVRVSVAGSQVGTVNVVAGEIATIELPASLAQPYVRNDTGPVPSDQIYTNKGVRVESEEPIVLTAINYLSDSDDGILALPKEALGRDYIIASATTNSPESQQQRLPSEYVITAAYDNTVVTIINTYNTFGHLAGETVVISLNKGDVYAAASQGTVEGNKGDLSGTTITSSRPVSVLAGHFCAMLPNSISGSCDYLVEMVPPVTSWGKVYHLMPIATRSKGDQVRVFAGTPGARIFLNGDHIATLSQKGGARDTGWINILPASPTPMQLISDKPIYVAQYANSAQYDQGTFDPFFMGVPPLEQYQTEILFTTPGSDYAQNYINLAVDTLGWESIEIASGISGPWRNLSATTGAVISSFPTLIDGVHYVGVTFRIEPGVYRLRGSRPFGGNIYGWGAGGTGGSYGYPLPAAALNLSVVDTVAPEIISTQDCHGTVIATVLDGPVVDAMRSNLSRIELDTASFNYLLDPRPVFDPGQDQVALCTLRVVDRSKDAMAILVVSDGRGNVTRDTFYYAAFNVTLAEDPTDFGSMNGNITPNPTREMTLRNLASRPATIREIVLKYGSRGFRVLSPTGEVTLAAAGEPGDRTSITVEFDPTISGTFVDSIGVRDDCATRLLAMVRANVGMPRIQVLDANFGSWPVVAATPAERFIKIRNISTDGGVLIVTGVAGGPSQPFIFATPDGYPAFPLRLVAGSESSPIRVTFDPAAPIAYIDSIHFAHNAGSGAANDSIAVLNGQGTTTTDGVETGSTAGLTLGPIAPTPTDGRATLSYAVPVVSMVEIFLVDATGRTVATLLEKARIEQGSHSLRFDVSALPAGRYFCRMTVGEKILVYPVVVR